MEETLRSGVIFHSVGKYRTSPACPAAWKWGKSMASWHKVCVYSVSFRGQMSKIKNSFYLKDS